MKTACNSSPANTSETYTVGGLNYTVGTTYTKTAGNKTATIKTMLDGDMYTNGTQTITASTISDNLGSCSSTASTNMAALKAILDAGPADTTATLPVTFTMNGTTRALTLPNGTPVTAAELLNVNNILVFNDRTRGLLTLMSRTVI
jgi:hypothetical protein